MNQYFLSKCINCYFFFYLISLIEILFYLVDISLRELNYLDICKHLEESLHLVSALIIIIIKCWKDDIVLCLTMITGSKAQASLP